MPATLLNGRLFAQQLRQQLKAEVAAIAQTRGFYPQLAVVQIQGDAASERYVRSIRRLCDELGIVFHLELLPAHVSQATLDADIAHLSVNPHIHAILIQMPLPAHLSADQAVLCLDPNKDVDGIHPISMGLLAQGRPTFIPNTPAGGMALLEHYGINPAGMRAAVVGRSAVVGRPMAFLLLQAHATVTICHSRTTDLGAVLRECDLVAVAAGRRGLVTGAMLRPGAIVLDFGVNVLDDGSTSGDVDFASASEIVSALTPVPGGTGPVTNMMLMRNVLRTCEQRV